MYNINFIRNLIKEVVEKKQDKFIIYPFGVNGISTRNVLKDYFDLSPCFIVDNEGSKYNSNIIDTNTLRKVYQNDMYVLLTIENMNQNRKMVEELLEYVPQAKIINFYEISNHKKVSSAGFLLNDFLPTKKYEKEEGKIKVRILHYTKPLWNSIRTICEAFKEDPLFDILLIGLREAEWVRKQGYNYIIWDRYQIQEDRPDILILTNPYEAIIKPDDCRKYSRLILAVSGCSIRYESSMTNFWKTQEKGFGCYRPDVYIYDPLLYNEIKESEYFSEKILEKGNAKFDGIFQAMQTKRYIVGWEKLKGKTNILWTTGHGVDIAYDRMKQITFDKYAKTIFEYADHNQNMGFIFRPHPAFIDEMMMYGFWSENDLNQLKGYCIESPNMIFDDTDTYETAFSITDGILADAFCGIIYSALPTLKPLCAMYRSADLASYNLSITESCYSARKTEDIIDFFEMIRNNLDPMLDLRKKVCERYIKYFDGRNGWRVKDLMKKMYLEKIGKLNESELTVVG